jgi:hypothetical protein
MTCNMRYGSMVDELKRIMIVSFLGGSIDKVMTVRLTT